jgi:hypothetical protein
MKQIFVFANEPQRTLRKSQLAIVIGSNKIAKFEEDKDSLTHVPCTAGEVRLVPQDARSSVRACCHRLIEHFLTQDVCNSVVMRFIVILT